MYGVSRIEQFSVARFIDHVSERFMLDQNAILGPSMRLVSGQIHAKTATGPESWSLGAGGIESSPKLQS